MWNGSSIEERGQGLRRVRAGAWPRLGGRGSMQKGFTSPAPPLNLLGMPIEQRPDRITIARLTDDPQFTADLDSVMRVQSPKPAVVILDFAGVRYLNSSNLARLLRLRKHLVEIDGRLV